MLQFTFDYQVRALVYYHTEAYTSAQDLLQAAACDPFVHDLIVPEDGLGESTFSEAAATRGSRQLLQLVDRLAKKVTKRLHRASPELGDLVAIDGSCLDASLSMTWADYTTHQRNAKVHLGFDLNRGIPRTLALTDGNGAERPFVSSMVAVGQTGVLDRGYQDHQKFDQWIPEHKHFVARIRANTQRTTVQELPFATGGMIFFFAHVLLGDAAHRMQHPVSLVGFRSRGTVYWVVTDRDDRSAEPIAFIFSLRWEIEVFFAWWKRHLKVYHLISRNRHGGSSSSCWPGSSPLCCWCSIATTTIAHARPSDASANSAGRSAMKPRPGNARFCRSSYCSPGHIHASSFYGPRSQQFSNRKLLARV